MITLGNGIELYTEDELPKVLTIDELKEFAQKEPYKPKNADVLEFYKNEENGLLYTHVIYTPWANDLVSHLLMETCIRDLNKFDWQLMTDYYDYRRIADYVKVWITPYTWLDEKDSEIDGYLIEGRVASTKYDKFRRDDIYKWATKMLEERETFLGNYIISRNEDSIFEEGRVLKGMNLWSLLTTNPIRYIQFVFENGYHPTDEESEGKISWFDTDYFHSNMEKIADKFGPGKAVEIVKALRKDWKHIVCFKLFNIDKISDQQVEAFRKFLFEGMDYYLEQWGEKKEKAPAKQSDNLEDIFTLRYRRTEDYNHLLQFLEQERKNASDADWARYALAIYEADVFIHRPKGFNKWLPVFCQLFGREVAYQVPNKLKRTACERDISAFLPAR